MAILAFFSSNTITQTGYDALRREVDWEHQQPQGGVFHAAGFDDHGHLRVADVWESAESMNRFVAERLSAAMQKLKLAPPEVEVFPAHNINAYKTINRYQV